MKRFLCSDSLHFLIKVFLLSFNKITNISLLFKQKEMNSSLLKKSLSKESHAVLF